MGIIFTIQTLTALLILALTFFWGEKEGNCERLLLGIFESACDEMRMGSQNHFPNNF